MTARAMTGQEMTGRARPAAARLAEGAAALGLAAALHLGAVALILPRLAGGGDGGAPEIALAAAPEAWTQLAEAWGRAPPVAEAPEPPRADPTAPPPRPAAVADAAPTGAVPPVAPGP
ncbi:MAG: hypothetical protein ACO38S_13455, partial [Gemmobacter sp.]